MKIAIQLFLSIVLCLSTIHPAQSQNQVPLNCGADKVLQGDSATRKLLAQFNQSYLIHSLNKAALDLTTIYTIPVVVHVYHLGEAIGVGSNVSTASVQAAIDALNQTFRAQGAFSTSQDVKIQFVLASRTPDCQATNGIVRVDARTISGYQTNGCSSADYTTQDNLRALSSWPTGSYINIRIVHKMPDAAGFTWFLDDLFLPAQYTNGNYPTLWGHEMGHSFNLYHTFEGDNANTQCPVNTNPDTNGDRISDTDPHKQGDNCSTYLPSSTNICTGLAFGSLLQNMMSYSGCLNRFTPKQVERMRYALQYYRPGLINSFGKIPPLAGELAPTAACVVSAPNGTSPYFGIETFTFNTISVGGGGSTSDNGVNYSDRTCLVQTNVQVGVPYSFSLTSLYGNTLGAKIYIDYNNNGSFSDANEQVFSSSDYNSSFTGTITVPVGTTANIKLRMRVMLDPTLSLNACSLPGFSPFGSGMAEDYGIIVTSATTCSPAIATLTGSQTSTPGQTVSLTVALTGTSPWNLTLNTGQAFSNITASPFVVTVAPTTVTTYAISNVSNACGSRTTLAPIAVDDALLVTANSPKLGTVSANDSDPAGLPLTFSGGQPSSGTVVMLPNGSYTYTPAPGYVGPASFTYSVCNSAGKCAAARVNINVQQGPTQQVSIPVRVFLQGALARPGLITASLMRDDLRRKGLIPTTEPYTTLGYVHVGDGSGMTIANPSSVFSVTGANAIIDWVMVELRSTTYPHVILKSTPGLLQADGDVVQTDGVSTVAFSQSALGTTSYQVSVHHRNHLGAMTANPISLSGAVPVVDFTSASTPILVDPKKQMAPLALERGLLALWAGNTNGDQSVILQGPNNDVDPVFFDVVDYGPNTSGLTNYIRPGVYLNSDVDMNGQVIFQGEDNEVDIFFFEIMLHPGNEIGQFINYIVWQQLP